MNTTKQGRRKKKSSDNIKSPEERNQSEYNDEASESENYKKIKRDSQKKRGSIIAKSTIRAGYDDKCDWRSQPISYLQGQVCFISITRKYVCLRLHYIPLHLSRFAGRTTRF